MRVLGRSQEGDDTGGGSITRIFRSTKRRGPRGVQGEGEKMGNDFSSGNNLYIYTDRPFYCSGKPGPSSLSP